MHDTWEEPQASRDEMSLMIREGHVLEWIGDPVAAGLDPEPQKAWSARQLKEAPARDPEHWARLARASGRSVASASEPPGDQRQS